MEHPPNHQEKAAFTLTELLIALGIIGVLSALAFPLYQRAQQSGKEIQCLGNLRSYGMAVLAYAGENNGLKWWDGKGIASQTEGSTYPAFEAWVRPYLHRVAAQRLRCPLIAEREKADNAFKNNFNYAGNSALNIYYPKLNSLPVPASRVFLAAEMYGTDGFNHNVHLNMTMWGIADASGYGTTEDLINAKPIRRPQYHGGSTNRGLNIFFLDGHAALIRPTKGDWREPPVYGTASNGGYFFEQKQFKAMKANPQLY